MNNDQVTQGEDLLVLLQDQAEIFLAVIFRPVVLQQLGAFLVVLLVAWLLPEAVRRWWPKRGATGLADPPVPLQKKRWGIVLYTLLTPALALLLLNVTIWLFARQGYPNGLLDKLTNLIWLWLIYRVILTLIYSRYGDAVRPYRNRIITPIFLFLVVWQIWAALPGGIAFTNATVSLGTISATLGSLTAALIVFYLFIVTAWLAKEIMTYTLPSRLNAEPGVIDSVATLVRYTFIFVGIIFSLSLLGLDFTSLAIVAGGLSVGIGIGLQEIVSNFVSGLVLLFEQSLRPGDVIELDGRISQVEKISLRATIVRTRVNEELIIPNASFTNQQVKNLTRSDRVVQVSVPFGVSYKSDPELVRRLAVETAVEHPSALPFPSPRLLFVGYGDSSLDFNLYVSIDQPELSIQIRSDLYFMLWQTLAEHEIEIPFPQRDLNLRTGWEKLASDKTPQ